MRNYCKLFAVYTPDIFCQYCVEETVWESHILTVLVTAVWPFTCEYLSSTVRENECELWLAWVCSATARYWHRPAARVRCCRLLILDHQPHQGICTNICNYLETILTIWVFPVCMTSFPMWRVAGVTSADITAEIFPVIISGQMFNLNAWSRLQVGPRNLILSPSGLSIQTI